MLATLEASRTMTFTNFEGATTMTSKEGQCSGLDESCRHRGCNHAREEEEAADAATLIAGAM